MVILGGGPAGLALGHYAKKADLSFTIYEAAGRVGGNCVTLEHGDFLFDSGAHRFHARDPQSTRELMSLMGDDLRQIHLPSQIYRSGKLIDFPLSPLNLLRNMGPVTFTRAGLEVIRGRLKKRVSCGNFEEYALQTYGPTLAGYFLLNYSEKLWGMPCRELAPDIAGTRMKGLDLKTFIKEALLGKNAKTEHLDGSFYYPRLGIGSICDCLARSCGPGNLRLNARVTRIFHEDGHIRGIELNGRESVAFPTSTRVVGTLPLDQLVHMLSPSAPADLLAKARGLRFRHLVLVVLFLDRPSVTRSATQYFPDEGFIFTRLYEPKNRSSAMAPAHQTSLALEIPCNPGDRTWELPEKELVDQVRGQVDGTGLIQAGEVVDYRVIRMNHAYPLLEVGYREKRAEIFDYLGIFANLELSGRNGRFVYAHLHDMMRFGREIIQGR